MKTPAKTSAKAPVKTAAKAASRRRPAAKKAALPAAADGSAHGDSRLFQVPKEAVARPRKLGELVAYAIQRDIAELNWPVGQVLGNQESLMARYSVSRSTLREAIRQVERHGIAEMRRGVNGGLVIQQPARDSVVLAVASYLELAGVRLSALFEAREVIENLMIGLICDRVTDAELQRLQQRLDDLLAASPDDVEAEAVRQLALRSEIAALSRNPALLLLLEALYRVTSDMLTVAPGHPRVKSLIREARREKQELVDAIVAGDEMAARIALRSALDRSRADAERQVKRVRQRYETASALTLSAHRSQGEGEGIMPKLGHRVSLRIADDIASGQWQVGERLGAESALCERYGVSRAVFREAVRTLELHRIVDVRRGLGGGLIAGAPDPTYTVELTSIYFRYARLKPRHFYELWRAIQVAAAQAAARGIDDAGRARLQALLDEQAEAPREAVLSVHGALHDALSALSGNPVIALFTKIMAEIAAHYPTEVPPAEIWRAFKVSHAELVGAVSRGEPAAARRIMSRHLKLVDAWYGEALREAWLQALGQDREAADAPPEMAALPRGRGLAGVRRSRQSPA